MIRLVEVRSYRLVPGAGPAFHELPAHHALRLLEAVTMDVLGFGPSCGDPAGDYLSRASRAVMVHIVAATRHTTETPALEAGAGVMRL